MPRLSLAIHNIKKHYTVVVVGSGYGGAIAASRLARAGQQVCVLERGREFQSGEFPDTEPEALAEVQAELPTGHTGSRTGLYDFYVNADVNVFVGCGLGGTSLINGNVALEADPRVFEDARWPQALRDDDLLDEGYRRARQMLQPIEYPAAYPALPKLEALEMSAAHLGQPCQRAPITVNFKEGVNHVGVMQHVCKLCGDCVSGCNYDAKNTVMFNYLPDARNFGAEIYSRVSVRYLERQDGRWLVHYQVLETGLEGFDAPTATVSADIVVLAAGTLGSTEILLRSKAAGLPLSDQVGEHFSGNGDVLGYSYGCKQVIDGVGYGHRDPRDMEAVGPCVTGMIDMRRQPELNDGIVIQEMTTPGALSGLLPAALATTASALGKHTSEGLELALAEESEVESMFLGPYEAATSNTQAYLVTTHEGGAGRMSLVNDRLEIAWPQVGQQPIFEKVNDALAEATRALGGTYMANPVWSKLFNRDLITLHPLGGCVMAEDAAHGVVNHKGQAFSGTSGTAVYDDLYVSDGAVIPRSLGASPLLTISALAERACALMAGDRGWQIDYELPSRRTETSWPAPLGIQFAATMRGDLGASRRSLFELEVTVISDDLKEMLRDPHHCARVYGRAVAQSLSAHPLAIAEGACRMMAPAAELADARQMVYRMKLAAREGQAYYLHASQQGGTLHMVLHEGDNESSNILGKAILRMLPQDLQKALATLRVSNAAGSKERLEATARFGRAWAGDLYDIYGGVVGGALARKKRPLRVNAPSVYHLPLSDAMELRLTRYEGGSRGPVILSTGPGVSSRVFALDTIETSLLEFLFAHGYDLWLLDGPDSIAPKDYQAAIDKVREVARVPSVQIVCQGRVPAAMTGLEGVRSAAAAPAAFYDESQLNAASREALHEIIEPGTPDYTRLGSLIFKNAAREVYPLILEDLEAAGLFARANV